MDNNNDIKLSSDDEVLLKITKLENKYLELKKELNEIKERFKKLEKTKVIF